MKPARNSKPLPRQQEWVAKSTRGGPVVDVRGEPAVQGKTDSSMWVNGPGGHLRTLRDKKAGGQ
jgi:hypothetical protein